MPSGQIRFFVLIFSFASFFTQIRKRRSTFSGGGCHTLKIDILVLIYVKNDAKEKKKKKKKEEKEKEKEKEKIGSCLSNLPFFDDRKKC